MSATQDPGLRRELRALGLGDDARRSSSYRAPAPIAEAPRPDGNRAGARSEPSPVLPSRRRRRRRRRQRRRRRRRLSWWQWWQRQRRRKKKRQKRSLSRRASIQKPRSPKDKACPEAAAVALGSPPQPSPSPLPGRRKVHHPKPRHRRRKRRIMELENFVANNLLLKARQGGCTPGSWSP